MLPYFYTVWRGAFLGSPVGEVLEVRMFTCGRGGGGVAGGGGCCAGGVGALFSPRDKLNLGNVQHQRSKLILGAV